MKTELKNKVKVRLAHKTRDLVVMKQEMQNLAVTIASVKGKQKRKFLKLRQIYCRHYDRKKEILKVNRKHGTRNTDGDNQLHDKIKEEADEQRDNKRRRNNIIIYNIPQSSAERADGRIKDDIIFSECSITCCKLASQMSISPTYSV